MTQEYGSVRNAYFAGREAVPDEECIMKLIDVWPISATLEEDHNIVDREKNPIELIMDV